VRQPAAGRPWIKLSMCNWSALFSLSFAISYWLSRLTGPCAVPSGGNPWPLGNARTGALRRRRPDNAGAMLRSIPSRPRQKARQSLVLAPDTAAPETGSTACSPRWPRVEAYPGRRRWPRIPARPAGPMILASLLARAPARMRYPQRVAPVPTRPITSMSRARLSSLTARFFLGSEPRPRPKRVPRSATIISMSIASRSGRAPCPAPPAPLRPRMLAPGQKPAGGGRWTSPDRPEHWGIRFP
jgi:hypothetical protein